MNGTTLQQHQLKQKYQNLTKRYSGKLSLFWYQMTPLKALLIFWCLAMVMGLLCLIKYQIQLLPSLIWNNAEKDSFDKNSVRYLPSPASEYPSLSSWYNYLFSNFKSNQATTYKSALLNNEFANNTLLLNDENQLLTGENILEYNKLSENPINNDLCWMNRDEVLKFGAIQMDNVNLINYIKANYMDLPQDRTMPYNLKNPDIKYQSQVKQDIIVEQLLKSKTNGFFIEAGAQDGEYLSNTLYFERFLNWTGLLVEPSPKHYEILKGKRRKAYLTNSCLSPKPYPLQIDFNGHQIMADGVELSNNNKIAKVQCFPLYSLLLAAFSNNTTFKETKKITIDYFSLDIDGPELEILQTIPFELVDIHLISYEFTHHPFPTDWAHVNKTIAFMKSKGYTIAKETLIDLIFVKGL